MSSGPGSPPPVSDALGAQESSLLPEVDARAILERLPAIVYVSEVGVDGQWLYLSGQSEEILGFAPSQWLADSHLWARLVHPEDRERVFAREALLEDPGAPEEYRMLHRNGNVVWIRDDATLVADGQGRLHWHGVMSDVTIHKLTQAELERRAAQQAIVASLGSRALEGADLNDLMGEAVTQATRILEVQAGAVLEIASDGTAVLVRAGSPLPDLQESTSFSDSQLPNGLTSIIEGRTSPWGLLCVQSSSPREYSAADVDFVHALANVLADAIQRRSTEDGIRSQALHDPLTGLPNRVLVLDRLEHARLRPNAKVAVLLLDVDRFKLVNDSFGHAAGDELLCEIAPRLREVLRPADTIGRLGGDEFVVLLEGIAGEETALEVSKRVIDAFTRPFELSDGEHFASISIGIAVSASGCEASETLIRDADAALYRAKEQGRARYELFDRAMRAYTIERLSIEADLRHALARDELRIAYQPVISLRDDSISSIEALLRWQHPKRGLLSPGEFISVAEESGLIGPIGEWVLAQACRQATEWHAVHPDAAPVGVSVNLSARQLSQRNLPGVVANALDAARLDPGCLCLEITESVLLDESSTVEKTMRSLVDLGVKVVLDDFGTSYSSLGCLTRLPIDGLKIDRSFTQGIARDVRATAIATAIVRMAQALSIKVVAEGVETALQADELRQLGCDEAQGFYFARPMPADQLVKVLSQRASASPRHAAPA